jgi:hypothetical protein
MLNCTVRYDIDSSFNLRKKHRLKLLQTICQGMFIPRRKEVKGGFGKFHNEELHNFSYIGALFCYETVFTIMKAVHLTTQNTNVMA